ncbi:uncharacterized protein LOC129291130 [Prosopis cineraria]|uniref:uncharacterized protein LOC129291130 n=1 Tax=Prosopis cineraria TaxID=364024 RepID=UPI00241097C7|nr:uncharacterized protein LOC129291130 [Prosopis cineraria]
MKSLAVANSSSFAVVHHPRSRSSPRVSYLRPEIRFSLHRRTDQLPKLRFLKLLQINGTAPIRASNAKVELDTADLPVQQTNEMKIAHVKFQLQRKCQYGEQFFIVGNDPLFGSWDPSEAIPMAWSDHHIWTAETDIIAGKTIQYKFILKERKGNVIWQPGSDRFIQTWETVNDISVFEDWDNAGLQKISEEQQHQHSNEESQQEEKPSISSSSMNTDCKDEQSEADRTTRIDLNGKATSIKNQESEVGDNDLFEF